MVNYRNGKIYKLVNNVDDEIYVGSTCNTLRQRLGGHKKDAKQRSYLVYQHLNDIGMDNVEIILIEAFPCDNKDVLHARERYWIDTLKPSLNKQVPTRTDAEYRQDNKDKITLYKKEYQQANKDKLALKDKEYYQVNKDKITMKQKEYKQANKDKIALYKKEYQQANKDKLALRKKDYYQANKDTIELKRKGRNQAKKIRDFIYS